MTIPANAAINQDAKINLQLQNASIKQVFSAIKKQANVSFMYSNDDVANLPRKNYNLSNATIKQVLDICLKGTNLMYEYTENTIIIRKKTSNKNVPSGSIQGIVRDPEGRPLPGATILLVGSVRGTSTDANGHFSLSLNGHENLAITVSFLGMKKQTISVHGGSYYNILMEADEHTTQEVVITGYGNIRKSSFTGSSTTVKRDELMKVSPTNVISALQTFDPSFRIQTNDQWGSDPNSLPEMYIRGRSGIGIKELDKDPLTKSNLQNNPNLPTFIMDGFQVSVEKVYETFLSHDVDFFTGVPDSLLKNICAYITDHTSREKHIIAANEGAAVGIASGYYMASGKVPVVYMQNSGLGNTVNPLLSLADEQVYSFPMLLMIGWRGEPGTKDEPQHKKQGEVTLDLLKAMRIPYIILDSNENDAFIQLHDIIQSAKTKNIPHAIIIRKDVFGKYKLQKEFGCNYPLSREDALQIVVDYLPENSVVVSTTGKLSRELFEYREMKEQGHEHDFLTVGSMGHSSSISLGIAIAKQDRPVYCLDGDGAFIMHLGAISNIGDLSPKNYYHILFNNGAHESVGGQPTLGFSLDIPAIVRGSGYKHTYTVCTKVEIEEAMKQLPKLCGPVLLEIKVKIDSRENLGRPTTTPIENKEHFMDFLK